jgi:hypothetical protein
VDSSTGTSYSPNSRPRPTRGARRKRERTRIRALGVRADLNGGDLRGDETRPIAEHLCRRRLAPAHYCLAGGRRILATVTRRRRLSLPTDRPHISTAQLAERAARARAVVASSDPFWPAQLAALAALLLYLLLPQKLTLGPAWLLPSVEALLLAGLVITAPSRHRPYSPRRRTFALGLIGLVTTVNFVSLGLLTHFLLRGGKTNGHALILAGVVIWLTNLLVFALWYWEIDRGGPITRVLDREATADFLFAQMPAS